jgi:cell division septum initiation protein DivIVA
VIPDDDPALSALLQRIASLEQALIEAQSAVAASGARAVFAEHQLAAVSASPSAPSVPRNAGRRGWFRRSDQRGDRYHGLGDRIEQLLALAEEQARDVLSTAQRDADQIRAAAVVDAAKIRTSRH